MGHSMGLHWRHRSLLGQSVGSLMILVMLSMMWFRSSKFSQQGEKRTCLCWMEQQKKGNNNDNQSVLCRSFIHETHSSSKQIILTFEIFYMQFMYSISSDLFTFRHYCKFTLCEKECSAINQIINLHKDHFTVVFCSCYRNHVIQFTLVY